MRGNRERNRLLTGVFGHFEGDFDVALCAEVVDLCWANLSEDVDEIGAIAEIAIVGMKLVGT